MASLVGCNSIVEDGGNSTGFALIQKLDLKDRLAGTDQVAMPQVALAADQ